MNYYFNYPFIEDQQIYEPIIDNFPYLPPLTSLF